MSQQEPASAPGTDPRHTTRQAAGDPWQAFAYVVSGVSLYGLGGWLLDRWLGTTFLVVIGILAGAGLGIYMTFGRFGPAAGWSRPHQRSSRTEE
jgi:ATP synthase protein I